MTSAQHLLSEDRPEFERILDRALRTAEHEPEHPRPGEGLGTEQLRTMALSAIAAICACAAAEYEAYTDARNTLRRPAPAPGAPSAGLGGLAGTPGEGSSAGLAAVVAVLAPVLSASAAAIFLTLGYTLSSLRPQPSMAQPIRTAGWFFAVLTVVTFLVAMAGLVLTALRNSSTAVRAAGRSEQMREVARARDEWEQALLERGIRPFLREVLTRSGGSGGADTYSLTRPEPSGGGHTPHLGYSRPGFSSPDEGAAPGRGPGYSSPDFTSPDFGGADHEPD